MAELGDFKIAAGLRDAIRKIVRNELDRVRPGYLYGQVSSIDPATRTVEVLYPGETEPVRMPYMGAAEPSAVGQRVKIDGKPGDRHVVDVIGPTGLAGTVTPGMPVGLKISPGARSLRIEWSESEEATMASGKGHYRVQIARDTDFTYIVQDASTASTYFAAPGLDPDEDYYIRVQAVTSDGVAGDWSTVVNGHTGADPDVLVDPSAPGGGEGGPEPMKFSMPGPIVEGGMGRDVPVIAGKATACYVFLDEPGINDSVVEFRRNGLLIATVTIAATAYASAGVTPDPDFVGQDVPFVTWYSALVITPSAQAMAMTAMVVRE